MRASRSAGLLALVIATLGLFAWLFRQEQHSLERGNRLYWDGDVRGAETIYREQVAESGRALANFNLGTTLLELGSNEAEEYLALAAESEDPAVARAAFYNLGRNFILRYQSAPSIDAAAEFLASSIESSRAALRLDPTDENVRWNLAIASRALAEILDEVPPDDTDDQIPTEGEQGVALPQLTQENRNSREEEAASEGDPGPIPTEEAIQLVDAVADNTNQLLQGILWANRPATDWDALSHIGGDW